jgi:hypothetical protein
MSKLRWSIYPKPHRGGGKGESEKRKSQRISVDYWFLGPLPPGEVLALLSLSTSIINLG